MKKRQNRKSLYLLSVLLAGAMLLTAGCGKNKEENQANADQVFVENEEETPSGPPQLEFPYALEDGALEINSVFQYTGANPDCMWEEGENTGAIVLVNRSEKYLEKAEIAVTLSNEDVLRFQVSDIPAGETAWVFEMENGVYPVSEYCVSAEGKAKFSKDKGLTSEKVAARAEGMTLELSNSTDKDLQNLTVRCHILFNDAYFGGTTYSYQVENIPAGGSTTVEATDCFLGEATAVWIGSAE